jgi:hypothetical protein
MWPAAAVVRDGDIALAAVAGDTGEQHRDRRVAAYERSAEAHRKAAVVHDDAARFFDEHGAPDLAERHRHQARQQHAFSRASAERAVAARRRAEAARRRRTAANERASASAERETAPPDERNRIADERDRIADAREVEADQRDRIADRRDRIADARDIGAAERDRIADESQERSASFVRKHAEFRLHALEITEQLAEHAERFAAYLEESAPDGDAESKLSLARREREFSDVARRNAAKLRESSAALLDLEHLPRLEPPSEHNRTETG